MSLCSGQPAVAHSLLQYEVQRHRPQCFNLMPGAGGQRQFAHAIAFATLRGRQRARCGWWNFHDGGGGSAFFKGPFLCHSV